MNDITLYQLGLNQEQIKALLPRGFFPTLPRIRMKDGQPVIQFLYTTRGWQHQDCFSITVTADKPHRVISLRTLEPEAQPGRKRNVPEITEEMVDYYGRCAAVLSIKDEKEREHGIAELEIWRSQLRPRLYRDLRFGQNGSGLGSLAVKTRGKTCCLEESF